MNKKTNTFLIGLFIGFLVLSWFVNTSNDTKYPIRELDNCGDFGEWGECSLMMCDPISCPSDKDGVQQRERNCESYTRVNPITRIPHGTVIDKEHKTCDFISIR